MSKLYIDITELVGWQGKLTGVPRVMDEISKRFVNQQVVFVEWKPQGYKQTIYPISHDQQAARVSRALNLVKKAHSKSRVIRKLSNSVQSIGPATKEKYIQLHKGDRLFVLADWHGGDPSLLKYLIDAHNAGVKLAQMVYDLLPVVTPQYSGHSTETVKTYSTMIYPLCDLVFSISENTKKDISTWLEDNKLRVPPIKVIRLGDDFSKAEARKPTEHILPSEYVLCLGTIEARKNHTLLYYAYKLGAERGVNLPPIAIVGRVGWLAADIYEIMRQDPEVKSKFIFMHNIGDEELSWLFEHCLFTVYPSFYEGWGLPIAESIAHGKPVIASNTSSMKEIAGELISYFNPASPEECLERIIELMDSNERAAASTRIKQYQPTSWDDTFVAVNKAIEGLII